jgi:hypothetical protein
LIPYRLLRSLAVATMAGFWPAHADDSLFPPEIVPPAAGPALPEPCMHELTWLHTEASRNGVLFFKAAGARIEPREHLCKLAGRWVDAEIAIVRYVEARVPAAGYPSRPPCRSPAIAAWPNRSGAGFATGTTTGWHPYRTRSGGNSSPCRSRTRSDEGISSRSMVKTLETRISQL